MIGKKYFSQKEHVKAVRLNKCVLKRKQDRYGYFDAFGNEYIYLKIGQETKSNKAPGCEFVTSLSVFNQLISS